MINHRIQCSHAQTPAARRACREGRLVGQPTTTPPLGAYTDLSNPANRPGAKPATWHVVPKASRRRPAYQVGERREIPSGNVTITQVRQADGTWWNIDVSIAPQYR